MDTIRKFRQFITDLHSQLSEMYRKHFNSNILPLRVVYRGQLLSINELEYLRSVSKSAHPIIKLVTFGSASIDPQVAMDFLTYAEDRIPCLLEIIITDEYKIEESGQAFITQMFADISSLSVMPHEQEVLFSLLTHFRVRDVGDSVVYPNRPWVPVTLELVTDRKWKYSYNYGYFIMLIQEETTPKNYVELLDFLMEIAKDKERFNKMNWNKIWSIAKTQWGTHAAHDQPVVLTLYQCFTEDKYYSRKAVEMHKKLLRSAPKVENNQDSFSDLFKIYESFQFIPAKSIAMYEQYIKSFCTICTNESIKSLFYAGVNYEKISDKDCALECYQTILVLDKSDIFRKNAEIQIRIKKLKKLKKCADKEFHRIQDSQHRQKSTNTKMKDKIVRTISTECRLKQLYTIITDMVNWYDMSDSKIILRFPCENTWNLSVNDYRCHFLSAVRKHLSWNMTETDAANNLSLSLWCYEKYMHDWCSLKALGNSLQPFKKKSLDVSRDILPKIEHLLKKIAVLITVCTVYICVEHGTGKIDLNNLQFIDCMKANPRQLIFVNYLDRGLLNDLEVLEENNSCSDESSFDIPDDYRDSSRSKSLMQSFQEMREALLNETL